MSVKCLTRQPEWYSHSTLLWFIRTLLDRYARWRLRRHGMLGMIQEYQELSGLRGGSPSDYLYLYEWVMKHRPKEILECGSGVSTLIMAEAICRCGYDGKITSMEEDCSWIAINKKYFPPRLIGFVEFQFSVVTEYKHKMFRGNCYADTPEKDYEFIFIDGPCLVSPTDKEEVVDMDYIKQCVRMNRITPLLVDSRLKTGFMIKAFVDSARVSFIKKQTTIKQPMLLHGEL